MICETVCPDRDFRDVDEVKQLARLYVFPCDFAADNSFSLR